MKRACCALLIVFFVGSVEAAGFKKVSRQLAAGMAGRTSKKVAVVTFLYPDSKFSSGSSIVAERLTTALVGRNNLQILERRLMQKILEEKRMAETGVVDPSTAKQLGSVLGVDALVTGTLIDLENKKTEVNARMIDAETGAILSATRFTVERTWNDKPRSSQPATAKPVAVKTAPPEPEEPPMPPSGPALRLSNENFPAGRRHYHTEKGAGTSKETDDLYYDDGPGVKSSVKKEQPVRQQPSLIDRRLEKAKRERDTRHR